LCSHRAPSAQFFHHNQRVSALTYIHTAVCDSNYDLAKGKSVLVSRDGFPTLPPTIRRLFDNLSSSVVTQSRHCPSTNSNHVVNNSHRLKSDL
jgi:hypothetical protein